MCSWWQRLDAFDRRFSVPAVGLLRAPGLRALAGLLAHSGDSWLWFGAGALLWGLAGGRWALLGRRAVLCAGLAWIASTVLKPLLRRPRPSGERGGFYLKIDRYAMPSGHATRAGALAVGVGALLPLPGALALGAWALAVCLSRVALGLHHPSDVIAGFGIGCALGGLLL